MRIPIAVACVLAVIPGFATSSARADFTPGDFYGSYNLEVQPANTNNIAHYSNTGSYIDAFSVPGPSGADTRGLAYGPDGLLYAVQNRNSDGLAVLAFSSTGAVQQTYTVGDATGHIGNGIYLGKIAFDNAGHFFVGTNTGLLEFNTGNTTSGTQIFSGQSVNDVRALGNGDLLIITGYHLYEINGSGSVVRDITPTGTGLRFVDLRGLEYDPATNAIYVSMLGYTGAFNEVMKLDFNTGTLLGDTTYSDPDDLFLTPDNRLIIGSRYLPPGIFDTSLTSLGQFSNTAGARLFVTEIASQSFAVPEPGSLALLATGAAGLLLVAARRRSAKRPDRQRS